MAIMDITDIEPLFMAVYELLEENGVSRNHTKGLYMITKFNYKYEVDNYTFTIKRQEGKNLLQRRNYILRYKNIKNITEININDKTVQYNCYYDKDDFILQINNAIVGRDLEINIKGNDTFISSVRYINEEIKDILYDLQITTELKERIDEVIFSDLEIRKKRVKLRKLKRKEIQQRLKVHELWEINNDCIDLGLSVNWASINLGGNAIC